MIYRVVVKPTVDKFILRQRIMDARAIAERLRSLAQEPRPRDVRKLSGMELWRVRVRDFRVVYRVDDKERVVYVERVARRSEDTYKGL